MKIFLEVKNIFPQVFNVSVSSAQRQIFVIALAFDIMQFDNMLQKCFNCSYRGSTSLPTRISNLLPIEHLPAQSEQ